MGHPHEVEDGEAVVPVAGHGAAGAALPVAVDRVGLDPLNVPEYIHNMMLLGRTVSILLT